MFAPRSISLLICVENCVLAVRLSSGLGRRIFVNQDSILLLHMWVSEPLSRIHDPRRERVDAENAENVDLTQNDPKLASVDVAVAAPVLASPEVKLGC